MKIVQFAKEICKAEGKLKQVNIGQIMEILRVINQLVGGALYQLIRKM